MRKKVVAGNWKMNMLPSEVGQFICKLKLEINMLKTDTEVIVCVPFVDLQIALVLCEDSQIKVGAQNVYFEENGAFTGEISVNMLKDINVEYVIIGHSERRQYFNETDEMVNRKIHAVLNNELNPIVCIGESLSERQDGITNNILEKQIISAFKDVAIKDMKNVIIAYEPIWAIGTGKVATPEDADLACEFIRDVIERLYGSNVAEEIVIQYGGSVNSGNAKNLFKMPNIDGALVGGASLKVDEFMGVIEAV